MNWVTVKNYSLLLSSLFYFSLNLIITNYFEYFFFNFELKSTNYRILFNNKIFMYWQSYDDIVFSRVKWNIFRKIGSVEIRMIWNNRVMYKTKHWFFFLTLSLNKEIEQCEYVGTKNISVHQIILRLLQRYYDFYSLFNKYTKIILLTDSNRITSWLISELQFLQWNSSYRW